MRTNSLFPPFFICHNNLLRMFSEKFAGDERYRARLNDNGPLECGWQWRGKQLKYERL